MSDPVYNATGAAGFFGGLFLGAIASLRTSPVRGLVYGTGLAVVTPFVTTKARTLLPESSTALVAMPVMALDGALNTAPWGAIAMSAARLTYELVKHKRAL